MRLGGRYRTFEVTRDDINIGLSPYTRSEVVEKLGRKNQGSFSFVILNQTGGFEKFQVNPDVRTEFNSSLLQSNSVVATSRTTSLMLILNLSTGVVKTCGQFSSFGLPVREVRS